MKRWGMIAASLALMGLPAIASADPAAPSAPASVSLIVGPCARPGLDLKAFSQLLRIELQADGVRDLRVADARPGAAPGLAVIAIEGACEGDPVVVIDDAATDKSVRRSIALGDVPAVARPRTLALAVAELLRGSWAELVLPEAPRPRALVPPEVRAATVTRVATATAHVVTHSRARSPEAPAAPRSWFVSAGFDARFFFGGQVALWGGRGDVAIPIHGPLSIRAALGGWAGSKREALGRIDLALVTGTLGLAVAVGVWRAVRVEVGPEIEMGWARASGEAALATTAILGGATWSAMGSVFATTRLELGGPVWAVGDVRFGGVIHGLTATAEGREATGIRGLTGGARWGIAVDL